jgi:hypothetical protein
MPVNNTDLDLNVWGRGRGDFRLPCGYVDPAGRVFNRIYLREMTGVEDDIMDDDELNVSERMSRVIANCTEQLTTDAPGGPTAITDKDQIFAAVADNLKAGLPITIPDRMATLLFIRRLSLGDAYAIDGRKCPSCGKPVRNKTLKLDALKINYCKDPTKRRVKVKLPRSGQIAVLRVLSASNERKISEKRPSLKDVKSFAILARLESLNDKPLTGDTEKDLEMVKALPKADRMLLINTFNIMEGSIDTEVVTNCTAAACGVEFKFDLDLGQVFFSNPETEVTQDNLNWV